jgi:NAD(P)H-dependent flavin oxidoreductase YrpB (nitropropane dioxygenase family)
MKIRSDVALTFDDVLLVPRRSDVRSRKQVDTSSYLTKQIRLKIPIVSANMDTVTETRMAIAMARQGGIGILHRFMTIPQQVEMVERVKRAESMIVDNPITIAASATVQQARELMAEREVGGLVVVSDEGKLLSVFRTQLILSSSLLEGSGIICCVITIVTGRYDLLVGAAVAVGLVLLQFPLLPRVEAWIDQHRAQLDEWRNQLN